ncbi:MAG: hypothetical protein ACYCT9_04585 [Leptospirillum sp.]
MNKQEEKYTVDMAEAHFVTAEVLRRGILASVTMGNAKKADVIARSFEVLKTNGIKSWGVFPNNCTDNL